MLSELICKKCRVDCTAEDHRNFSDYLAEIDNDYTGGFDFNAWKPKAHDALAAMVGRVRGWIDSLPLSSDDTDYSVSREALDYLRDILDSTR